MASLGFEASRGLIRPFPFCKPVSAASPFTLEFRHSSTALRADQVDDGRDDARVRFAWECVKGFHNRSPIQTPDKCARGRHGPQTTEMCRAGFYALGRSELVGCGVRSGHQMPAASLQDESARAMPMPTNK